MICGIDPKRAPLARYNSEHLKQIKLLELSKNLSSRGVDIVGGGDGHVVLSLRNLIPANGTLQRAQQELMAVLSELGVDSVTMEPADLEYVGGRDLFTLTVARGLESGVPQIAEMLTGIPISEDGDGNEAVPLFERIDRASVFAATDRHGDENIHARLREGAGHDLERAGLLPANNTYTDFLEPRQDEPAELPEDYRAQPQVYRSIFDREGGY